MRCDSCNKFVSFDTETEPDISVQLENDGTISGTVRIVNTCAECGQEMKETTFDVECDCADEIETHRTAMLADAGITLSPCGENGEAVYHLADGTVATVEAVEAVTKAHEDLTLDHDGGNRTERMQSKDRHGKPIKSARYMKHLYGAEVTFTVACKCGEEFVVQWADEVQGSGMEELI